MDLNSPADEVREFRAVARALRGVTFPDSDYDLLERLVNMWGTRARMKAIDVIQATRGERPFLEVFREKAECFLAYVVKRNLDINDPALPDEWRRYHARTSRA